MAELQVGIRADVSEARRVTRALKDIKREAGGTATSLQAAGAAASKTSLSLATTTTASGALAKSQNLAAVANIAVANTLRTVSASATKTATAEAVATTQTNRLTAAFTRLRAAATGIFTRPTAAVRRFGTQARTALGSVAGASTAAAGIGATIAVGFGIGVKSALEFESTLAKIQGLVGIAADEVDAFKKPLLELGKTVGKGPTELADALFFVTSAGFRGKDALNVLEASAKAAAAGLGETKLVADAVTSAVNAYGLENLTAAQSTDILVATVREGKAEADSIAGALGQVLPAASELGVEFSELGGTIAALTRIGLGADQGATALGATLSAIQKPGEQAKKTLEEFGTSAVELRRKVREEGLLPALQDLQDRFGDNEEALTKVFPNIRALRAILPLVGKNAGDVAGIFERVADSVGSTDSAFGAVELTYKQRLQKALVDLQTTLLEVGEKILPAVTFAFEGLVSVVTSLGDAFIFVGDATKAASEGLAAIFVGSDDPVLRNLNNIRELRDELERLEAGGATRRFFTEVGGIDLSGSREEQLAQLRERLSLERTIELQMGREELQRQRANRALEDAAGLVKDIQEAGDPPVAVIDQERQEKALKSLAELKSEVELLTATATNLQELGQEGIGLAEDFALTSRLARDLQGDVLKDAQVIRGLVNEKRRLEGVINDVTAAFQRQDAATEFLSDLDTDVANLAEKLAFVAGGGQLFDIDALQQARAIFADLSEEQQKAFGSPEAIQRQLVLQEAYNAALKQIPVDNLQRLVSLRDTLVQQRSLATSTEEIERLSTAIASLNKGVLDQTLGEFGLPGLDEILFEAQSKEDQFRIAGDKLREAFNAEGIVDPDGEKLDAALQRLQDKIFGISDVMAQFGKAAAENLQQSFSDFLFDPFEDGLDGMVRGFADALRRLAADLLANQILTSFFKSFAGGGGAFGNFANAALGALGGGQGGFADGGNFSANRPMLVGERGPEIITPRQSGSVIPNEMLGGQAAAPKVEVGGPTIVNTIDDGQIVAAFNRGGGGQVVLNDMTERKGAYRQALGL